MNRPESPKSGEVFINTDDGKSYVYDGTVWVEQKQVSTKNRFAYRSIYNLGSWVYSWEVELDGNPISGTSNSVRKAYRDARKEVKRHRKMMKFLNKE